MKVNKMKNFLIGLSLVLSMTSYGSGFFGGGGGGGAWGSISGTLSDQTDLSTALAGKVAAVSSTTDNAIVRYDGTSGQVQNSVNTVLDTTGEILMGGGSGANLRWNTNNAGDIGDTDGTNAPSNITGGTMVQFASSSTNYARLANLAGNSPMLVMKSGSSNPIQLYAYSDGVLYLAFNGSDKVTFTSAGNMTITGGIGTSTYLTTGSFGTAMQTVVGTDAGSSVISANIGTFYLNPAGSLSTYTITMPASPYNGMIVRLTSSQVVTTLTHAANSGHTITAPLTSLAVGSFGVWQYHSATTNWIRIG